MATHKLEYYFEVEFEDGTHKEIPWPDNTDHKVYMKPHE